jgi:hypothetical protein
MQIEKIIEPKKIESVFSILIEKCREDADESQSNIVCKGCTCDTCFIFKNSVRIHFSKSDLEKIFNNQEL